MSLHTNEKVFGAVAVQILIIFVLILFKMAVLTSGTEVALRIAPVDPRDMLRGDYITFRYTISEINISQFDYNETFKNGDTVYVPLQKPGETYDADRSYWTAGYGIMHKKLPGDRRVFLKGTIRQSGVDAGGVVLTFGGTRGISDSFKPQTVHIEYGIEQYFIREGAGSQTDLFNREAAARVAIDENGNAVLKKIFIDKKPWP